MVLGSTLIGIGALTLGVAVYAESYHDDKYMKCTTDMECAAMHRGAHEAARVYREFLSDTKVKAAMYAITYGYPLGILSVLIGGVLLLV